MDLAHETARNLKKNLYNSYVEPYLSKFSTSSFERATS